MIKSCFRSSFVVSVVLAAGSICQLSHALPVQNPPSVSDGEWTVDGKLDETFWDQVDDLELMPVYDGVPVQLGGYVRAAFRGGWLCLGAFLPEPGGTVMARSIGYNPVWERYALTSPPVEDRIQFQIQDPSIPSRISILEVAVNPWGAMRIERDGVPVAETAALRAVDITPEGWSAEVSIPIREATQFKTTGSLQMVATRIRSRRPLSPEYRWKTGELELPSVPPMAADEPSFRPPVWGSPEPDLLVGRVQKVPPLDIAWDDSFWSQIQGFELPRNEPNPRRAEYPTRVKWVHDGTILQIFFENAEDGRLDVDVDTRDGNVSSDDHVALYLALSGSASVEILVNPVGAVRDALSSGPHAFGSSAGAFDADISGNFIKEKDRWMVRLNLPLAEIASALGGEGVPRDWKVLIGRVRQERPGEPAEISTVPVVESSFLNAPARFRGLRLTDSSPSQIAPPRLADLQQPGDPVSRELRDLNPYALSRVERRYYDVARMLRNQIDNRTERLAMEEHAEWDKVETLRDWEAYRDLRMPVLREALGEFPHEKCSLEYEVTSTFRGEGYQILNIAYQSRPGFYIAANLYLPANPAEKMPGMIILPAHHYPKTHGEMKDSGMVWARSGVAVLIMEHIGFGERLETSPLYRDAYESEYLFSEQLELVGQSLQGWVAYDVIRTVDLFEELGTIDMDRIILIGSVTWGGGRQAAPAGLFEERIDAEIIYNFGRVYWYGWGIRNLINNKITPWFVVNAFAPRRLVYAHEFWYEGEEGPVYPEVWVPAWPRYQKVYALYDREGNLATAQGEGLLRAGATEFVPRGDCYMLGTVQRKSLYPILSEWFGISYPSEADQNIPLDSGLSDARERVDYEVIKYQESQRRPSDEAVLSIPPAFSSRVERRALHQIALQMAAESVEKERIERHALSGEAKAEALREQLRGVLGDVDPESELNVVERRSRVVQGAEVEMLVLESEEAIIVPLFLLKPAGGGMGSLPVVVGLAEGGKSRFLIDRATQLAWLLRQGFALCIPDVRGTGETAFSQYNRGDEPALSLAELGESLLGSRLKDVRTVLKYLKNRPDIDKERILLWGDSFAAVNSQPIWVDELLGRPVSPQIQHVASPLGSHLALLAALYEPDIRAIAVRGGLVSYLSLLETNINYVPPDMAVSGLLQVADISDIAACLNPMPLMFLGPVDGRNFPADQSKINTAFHSVRDAYGSLSALILAPGMANASREADRMVKWLADHGSDEM